MSRDRGAVSIVLVAGALIFCLLALCAADLGSMTLARARAQAAADAAALAAARQQVPSIALGSETPEDAARDAAAANGARLVACWCDPGTPTARVDVEVGARPVFVRAWSGRPARATARADADADVLTYRTEP